MASLSTVDLHDPMCLMTNLNIYACRRFLFQIEHELLKFVNIQKNEKSENVENATHSLRFPVLQDSFAMLLRKTAARFGLEVKSGTLADGRPDRDGLCIKGTARKPKLLFTDIVRHQLGDMPKNLSKDSEAAFMRLKAVAPILSEKFQDKSTEDIDKELDRLKKNFIKI